MINVSIREHNPIKTGLTTHSPIHSTVEETLAIMKGIDGKSAYELALSEGFEGTLSEWLRSLALTYERMTEEDKRELAGRIDSRVRSGTKAQWQVEPTYVPPAGQMIIVTDAFIDNGVVYAGIKIGDGKAYIVDLPYVSDDVRSIMERHLNDTASHVSIQDRIRWNNKITCDDSIDGEELILTK